MRRLFLILGVFFCAQAVNAQDIPPMGKSMGRWTSFSLESMRENKAEGLDFIEVTMNDVIGKNPEGVYERACLLMAEIQESGLKVWSVHMPYSNTLDISVIDDEKRGENVQYLKEMMRVAGVFHPRRIVLHPSSEPIALNERGQRLRNSHKAIGELAAVAKEIGSILCVENLCRFLRFRMAL